ncbi:MAG: hypothetical protein H6845_00925 [Alphaproteobacteria bacterium]|nr:MAG: hypothetical protein H6845_00925 [Alphaproteobacteria bacterium]
MNDKSVEGLLASVRNKLQEEKNAFAEKSVSFSVNKGASDELDQLREAVEDLSSYNMSDSFKVKRSEVVEIDKCDFLDTMCDVFNKWICENKNEFFQQFFNNFNINEFDSGVVKQTFLDFCQNNRDSMNCLFKDCMNNYVASKEDAIMELIESYVENKVRLHLNDRTIESVTKRLLQGEKK